MEITRNKYVSLTYELRRGGAEGELVERASEETPLSFVFGAGLMLPKFEDNLLGLKSGDSYKFLIETEDAYGPVFEERVVDLPKNIFEINGKIDDSMLEIGNVLPMMDAQGNRLKGKIITLTEDVVTMDFNHPMAGESLFFSGNILDVREASENELADAAGLNSSCGCGSGGCGDGSCGDGGCSDESCCSTEEGGHSHGGCGCGCN